MKYVSDERLKELSVNNPEFDLHIETLHKLVNRECKELPDQQWQTIEGFKSENHECYCFVVHSDRVPMLNFYHAGKFYVDETCYKLWVGTITHVMPIKTPEAPK